MKKIVFIGLLLAFVLAISGASNIVTEIKINGNQNIDKALINSVLVFKLGGFLTAENTAATIKNLYKLGIFDDVRISVEEQTDGVVVFIDIKEYPIIDKVKFKGNDKIKAKKLIEISGLLKGTYWSPFFKTEIENKIKKEYKEKNYHFANVLFEEKRTDENLVNIDVFVDEGSKIRVKKITFHGNREISAKKLRSKMDTKQKSLFRSGKFEREKLDEDLKKIISYMSSLGYIDCRIISHETDIKDKKNMIIDQQSHHSSYSLHPRLPYLKIYQ